MSIELQTGNQVDVTSSSDAELYAGMFGDGNYVIREPLELKMEDANTLSIGTGNALHNGRHIRFKGSTELTIPSGSQAQKRSHIAVVRTTVSRDDETMETIEKSEGLVLSGEPTMDGTPEDPKWIEGNLLKGDTIADFPIAKVITDGINAGEPQPLYDLMTSHAAAWDSLSQTGTYGSYPLFVQHTANTGFVIFSNYKIPRAFHAYNWYEIMTLPTNLLPLTLSAAAGSTTTGIPVLMSITQGGVVRINPGENELPENMAIYGCIPYVLA